MHAWRTKVRFLVLVLLVVAIGKKHFCGLNCSPNNTETQVYIFFSLLKDPLCTSQDVVNCVLSLPLSSHEREVAAKLIIT